MIGMNYILWSRDNDYGIDKCLGIYDTQDRANTALRNARHAGDGWHVHWVQDVTDDQLDALYRSGLKVGRIKYI